MSLMFYASGGVEMKAGREREREGEREREEGGRYPISAPPATVPRMQTFSCRSVAALSCENIDCGADDTAMQQHR